MNGGPTALLGVIAQFGGVLFLVAVVLLWLRSRSPWLLAAIVAGGLSLAFRLGFALMSSWFIAQPTLMAAWQFAGLMQSACLLGFAIEFYNQRSESV